MTHNILRGPNFGGLLGGYTKTPIHTLHNAIEDAKSNKKPLWIAFQDMSKAFDSVGMIPLRHALSRIRLPPLAIDLHHQPVPIQKDESHNEIWSQ